MFSQVREKREEVSGEAFNRTGFSWPETPCLNPKHDLEHTGKHFLGRENREKKRRKGSRRGDDHPGNVLKSKGDYIHIPHHRIAVAEIRERLDIARSEQFLGRGGI